MPILQLGATCVPSEDSGTFPGPPILAGRSGKATDSKYKDVNVNICKHLGSLLMGITLGMFQFLAFPEALEFS